MMISICHQHAPKTFLFSSSLLSLLHGQVSHLHKPEKITFAPTKQYLRPIIPLKIVAERNNQQPHSNHHSMHKRIDLAEAQLQADNAGEDVPMAAKDVPAQQVFGAGVH